MKKKLRSYPCILLFFLLAIAGSDVFSQAPARPAASKITVTGTITDSA